MQIPITHAYIESCYKNSQGIWASLAVFIVVLARVTQPSGKPQTDR